MRKAGSRLPFGLDLPPAMSDWPDGSHRGRTAPVRNATSNYVCRWLAAYASARSDGL
jgi:hypothetical protein